MSVQDLLRQVHLTEPGSITEAEMQIAALQIDIKAIESQLANRNAVDEQGRRMTPVQYHTWRKRAVGAVNIKRSQLTALRAWLRETRAEADRQTKLALYARRTLPLGDTGRYLLGEASRLLGAAQAAGWEPEPAEYPVLGQIRDYVRHQEDR